MLSPGPVGVEKVKDQISVMLQDGVSSAWSAAVRSKTFLVYFALGRDSVLVVFL